MPERRPRRRELRRHALGILGIGDRPPDALDQLLGGVLVAEVDGVDALVEKNGGLLREPPQLLTGVGGDDDSRHDRPSLWEIGWKPTRTPKLPSDDQDAL